MSKLAAAKPCANCGHTEFTRDFSASAGDVLCSNCGLVQIENPIVSEVQFGESSSGAATVQGAMVGADQARAFNMRNSLESREQTMMNAKQKIRLLATVMRIPDYISESAHGWFKLALVQNFVQGRRSQNVIAACLYVACRHEKTPHLLIDFSSRLQISVYSLGATYLKLVRALHIQKLPLADPSLFIQHFAERLGFKEQTAKVCRDATKIAQRMSSDWIYEGRRPAGIAGACLLLAARMNNFRRSHAEIVAVARVGEETLQKRLNEFKKTSSASLSVQEFRDSVPTNDSKPPSYEKNRSIESKIEKLLRQRNQTLKKYKEMAKNRQLYAHLDSITSEAPAKESAEAGPEEETTTSADKAVETETNGTANTDAAESTEGTDNVSSNSKSAVSVNTDGTALTNGTKCAQKDSGADDSNASQNDKLPDQVAADQTEAETPVESSEPAATEKADQLQPQSDAGNTAQVSESSDPAVNSLTEPAAAAVEEAAQSQTDSNSEPSKPDAPIVPAVLAQSKPAAVPQPEAPENTGRRQTRAQTRARTRAQTKALEEPQVPSQKEPEKELPKKGKKVPAKRGRKGAQKKDQENKEASQQPETKETSQNSSSTAESSSKSELAKPNSAIEASDSAERGDEEDVNELFVPASGDEDDDDDDFGYSALPDDSEQADSSYDQRHTRIMTMRQKKLATQKKTKVAPKPKAKSTRLGSIADSRGAGRRGRGRVTARVDEETPAELKRKAALEAKKLKEKKKLEELEARDDELLKAVLRGGDIKEEDLEIALDKILQGQKRSLDSSLYRNPADQRSESDVVKQIDMDRPRNLVLNNPTTSQILSRVRDDETINTDDEDEEVLNVTLNEEEKMQKERIWIALNHDFLIEQEKKRLKIEADELTGNTSGQPRKRRKIKVADPVLDDAAVANAMHSIGEGGRMITPAENAKQMLQKKSFSRKINYSSIGDLFNE